ncbi:MAG: amino acid--tRNA ligase-related protein, partial [Bacteroidales bacterium]|nr:amino acid--tRNA ligase-related protein [Bacteroidales bacterium]
MKRTEIKQALLSEDFEKEINVKGWVRTKRASKNVAFIALNDGSVIHNLQLVVDLEKIPESELALMHTGASVSANGVLVPSAGSGQRVELAVQSITLLGEANPDEYPLQPKKHSLEFLREKAHLRFRTNTFSAISRLRHAMIFAVHKFFNDKGYFNIHAPIITASDAEGAGEMFQVTTLELKKLPFTTEGEVDFKQDFFGKPTNLTVSGQLEGELAALALSKVYTFGPTFRAENS